MADGFDVVFRDVDRFTRAITEMNSHVRKANEFGSLKAAAELVLLAQREAPKGLTGDLAGSMKVSGRKVGPDSYITQVGPTVVYGRRVDLGFKGRRSARGVKARRTAGIDTGRRGLQPTKKNPFLERAVDLSHGPVIEVFKRSWGAAMRRNT